MSTSARASCRDDRFADPRLRGRALPVSQRSQATPRLRFEDARGGVRRRARARRGARRGDRGGGGRGGDELWSLGDMIGDGPGPRARRGAHARALRGRADGQPRLRRHRPVDRRRFGEPGVARGRSIELARERLAAERRRVDAHAQAGGPPRRRAVLARQPAQRRPGVRRARATRPPAWTPSAPSSGSSATRTSRPRCSRRRAAPAAVTIRPGVPLDLAAASGC